MSEPLPSELLPGMRSRLLAMADDELVLAHRNSEWTGHAPILEEDIAFSNIAQDEMGHAVLWYNILHDITGEEPDYLVFQRDAAAYRNIQLVELPRGDWAFTIVRQYLFDAYEQISLDALSDSKHRPLAHVAVKLRPEERYHYRHTSYWLRRLGLGTEESQRRTQSALDELWPLTGQLFSPSDEDAELIEYGCIPDPAVLKDRWLALVLPFLKDSGLRLPEGEGSYQFDRTSHTPHLASLLAEMQEVARLDADAHW